MGRQKHKAALRLLALHQLRERSEIVGRARALEVGEELRLCNIEGKSQVDAIEGLYLFRYPLNNRTWPTLEYHVCLPYVLLEGRIAV